VAVALVCAVLASEPGGRGDPVSEKLQWYVANGFENLTDLAVGFQGEQYDRVQLVPPGMPYLVFDNGLTYAKWSGFPKEFVAGLVGVLEEGVAVYPVTVFEDAKTRQYVFLNALGQEFYSMGPAPGYDPRWILLARIPDFYSQGHTAEQIAAMEWLYDPARVVMRYTLIGKPELRQLLTAQAKAEAEQPFEPMKMTIPGGSGGPNITNLIVSALDWVSNSLYMEVSYPTNFTNQVDIFSADGGSGLMDFWWTLRLTTNISTETNYICWTDTTASNAADGVRFYVAANADLTDESDPDEDGLTWGREKYLYHSSPTNYDTDSDGLSDYEEAINLDTDPCNSDTNKPTVIISFPTNNFNWVWLP